MESGPYSPDLGSLGVPIAFFIHAFVNLLRSLVLQIYVGMINCSHCYNCKSVIVLLGAINEFEFEFDVKI